MTKYFNKVGPGYVAPPRAEEEYHTKDNTNQPNPEVMVVGCTDPDADNFNPLANSDDGSCIGDLIEIDDDDDVVVDTSTPEVKTAGFMGIPKIAWIAIIGVGLYYAYSKGMFKKLMK